MVPTSAGKVDLPALTAQKQNLIESMRETKYAAVLLFCGLTTSVGNVAFSSLLQSQFLEELRGRAVGGLDVLWQTRRLLSLPGGGLLADAVGTRAVYLLLLVATAVGAGVPAAPGARLPFANDRRPLGPSGTVPASCLRMPRVGGGVPSRSYATSLALRLA